MEREAVKEKANSLGARVGDMSLFDTQKQFTLEKELPIDQFLEHLRYYQQRREWLSEKSKDVVANGKDAKVLNRVTFKNDTPIKSDFRILNGDGHPMGQGVKLSNPADDVSKWNPKSRIQPLPDAVEINLAAGHQAQHGVRQLMPEPDKNLVGKAQIQKDIMESAEWLKGKSGDLAAAMRVVDDLLPDKKMEQLKKMLGSVSDKVLVTMPSTSGMNVIPKAIALKLAKAFNGKLQAIQGDEFFNLTHNKEIKNISRFDRVFYKRKYVSEKPFAKNLAGKKAVLVDDVFTTGGSVKAFVGELANHKLNVSHIVGLMGDKRFSVDEKTAAKLKSALNENGIEVDSEKLSKFLTRTEAGMFIQKINNKGKGLNNDQRRDITGRVQGLIKGLFVKNIKRDRDTGRDSGPGRAHHNNAKNAKRVQGRGPQGGYGR